MSVDARPLEDNLRPIDVTTVLDSWEEDEGRAMTLHGRPEQRTGKQFRFRLEAGQWWELVLNIKPIMGRAVNDPSAAICFHNHREGPFSWLKVPTSAFTFKTLRHYLLSIVS